MSADEGMKHTRLKLIAFLFLLMGCLSPGHLRASQGSNPLPKPRRNRQQEDVVAKLFDQVRKEANLRPMSRIENRRSLQQLACTVAVTDDIARFRNGFPVLGNGSIDGVTKGKKWRAEIGHAKCAIQDT